MIDTEEVVKCTAILSTRSNIYSLPKLTHITPISFKKAPQLHILYYLRVAIDLFSTGLYKSTFCTCFFFFENYLFIFRVACVLRFEFGAISLDFFNISIVDE